MTMETMRPVLVINVYLYMCYCFYRNGGTILFFKGNIQEKIRIFIDYLNNVVDTKLVKTSNVPGKFLYYTVLKIHHFDYNNN